MSVSEPLVQASLIGEAIDPGPVLVLVADEDMNYIAANRYACEVLGYTRNELLALTVEKVAGYPEAPSDYAEMIAARKHSGTAVLTRKDGGEVNVRYLARETKIARLTFYVSVCWVEADTGA